MFRLIFFLLFSTLVLAALPAPLLASSCELHEQKVKEYNRKRRMGGSSRQMNTWLQKRNHHQAQLAECIRNARHNHIHTARGPARRSYVDRQPELKITASDPRLVRLYQTCNFWIREHNTRASSDTLAQRNAACRIAREAAQEIPTQTPVHQRSLQECIKPGNLIDNDVSACLQGKLTPDWKGL